MSGAGSDRVAVAAGDAWPDSVDAEEAIVVTWFVREGQPVEAGQSICEIQVEKVDVDVLAPVDGRLVEIVHGEDDEIGPADTLAWIAPD